MELPPPKKIAQKKATFFLRPNKKRPRFATFFLYCNSTMAPGRKDIRTWLLKNRDNERMWTEIANNVYPASTKVPVYVQDTFRKLDRNSVIILRNGMYVTKSKIEGAQLGLFCVFDIPANIVLGSYNGKKLSVQDFEDMKQTNPSVFGIKERYVFPVGKSALVPAFYIDPTDENGKVEGQTNFLVYVNEPPPGTVANTFPDLYFEDGKSDEDSMLQTFVTCRKVPAHSEFYMHYGDAYERDYKVGERCAELPSVKPRYLCEFMDVPDIQYPCKEPKQSGGKSDKQKAPRSQKQPKPLKDARVVSKNPKPRKRDTKPISPRSARSPRPAPPMPSSPKPMPSRPASPKPMPPMPSRPATPKPMPLGPMRPTPSRPMLPRSSPIPLRALLPLKDKPVGNSPPHLPPLKPATLPNRTRNYPRNSPTRVVDDAEAAERQRIASVKQKELEKRSLETIQRLFQS